MKRTLSLYSALLVLLMYATPKSVSAQNTTGDTFEGVLHYSTLENSNKNAIRLSQGIAYNGVRHYNIYVKGDNIHIEDTSMHLHTIVNLDVDSVYFYSDAINRGIGYAAGPYIEKMLSQFDPDYMEQEAFVGIVTPDAPIQKVKINDYRIEKTGEQKTFMNLTNEVYRGPNVARGITTDFEIWVAEDFSISPSIRYFLYGCRFEGLPTKYVWDQKGHVPLLGKLTTYVASELKSIDARLLDGALFLPPADCKMIDHDDTGFKRIGLQKDNTKFLKKHGQYPTDAQKESDVTYQIDDEWDF